MNRRVLFLLPLLLAAGFLIWILLPALPKAKTEQVWRGWEGKSFADSEMYIAEKDLEQRGAHVQKLRALPREIGHIDVLYLRDGGLNRSSNADGQPLLLQWVKDGGRLITKADYGLRAGWYQGKSDTRTSGQYKEDWQKSEKLPREMKTLRWTQYPFGRFNAALAPLNYWDCPSITPPADGKDVQTLKDSRGCVLMLSYALGKGRVTVFADNFELPWASDRTSQFRFWEALRSDLMVENLSAVQGDNLAIWQDLTAGAKEYRRLERLRLSVLPEKQLMLWLPFALLFIGMLLAALCYGQLRFGSLLLPDAPREMRDFAAHFQAAGAYLLKNGNAALLAEAVKARLLRDTAGERPEIQQQAQELCAKPADNAEALTALVREAQALRRQMTGEENAI